MTTRFLPALFFAMSFCLSCGVTQAIAQDTPENEATQDEQPSDKIVIKNSDSDTISEFRINGQLYMIRITPKKGVPYYLVDSDGDGNLETRWNELAPDLLIPSWVLLRW